MKTKCHHCGNECDKSEARDRSGKICERSFCNRTCYLGFHSRKLPWKCPHCGKEKQVSPYYAEHKKFCSSKCYALSHDVPARNCKNCNKPFVPTIQRGHLTIRTNSRTLCSKECALAWISNNEERKRKISIAMTGKNHPLWQGGKSLINSTSNRGPNWKIQSAKALKRDGFKCCDCKRTSGLVVHHKIPFHNFDSHIPANKLPNLETLCRSCHITKEHKIKGTQKVLTLTCKRSGHSHRRSDRGSKHHSAQLDELKVIRIKQRLASGPLNVSALAREFSVTNGAIKSIQTGRSWAYVKL